MARSRAVHDATIRHRVETVEGLRLATEAARDCDFAALMADGILWHWELDRRTESIYLVIHRRA